MLLLKLISPKKLPRKRSEWRFRHKCYMALLKWLKKHYILGVIDEVVVVNDVMVSHTLRDEWFEDELQRFGIGCSITFQNDGTNSIKSKKYRRSSLFLWKETLVVLHGQTKCSIVRDTVTAVESNLEGSFKVSTSVNGIFAFRIEEPRKETATTARRHRTFRSEPTIESTVEQATTDQEPATTPPKKKHKIRIKDTIDPDMPQSTATSAEVPTDEPQQGTFTQHIGFVENELF